eukprot:2935421-Rhodomonas_salina.1
MRSVPVVQHVRDIDNRVETLLTLRVARAAAGGTSPLLRLTGSLGLTRTRSLTPNSCGSKGILPGNFRG